jgi:hypothetical protein
MDRSVDSLEHGYYTLINGKITGPHLREHLYQERCRLRLPSSAFVRQGTSGEWVKVKSLMWLQVEEASIRDESSQMQPPAVQNEVVNSEVVKTEGVNVSAYGALRSLAIFYQVAAHMSGICGLIGVFAGITVAQTNGTLGVIIVFVSILLGVIGIIILLAMSEGIRLLIEMQNTLCQIRDRLPISN